MKSACVSCGWSNWQSHRFAPHVPSRAPEFFEHLLLRTRRLPYYASSSLTRDLWFLPWSLGSSGLSRRVSRSSFASPICFLSLSLSPVLCFPKWPLEKERVFDTKGTLSAPRMWHRAVAFPPGGKHSLRCHGGSASGDPSHQWPWEHSELCSYLHYPFPELSYPPRQKLCSLSSIAPLAQPCNLSSAFYLYEFACSRYLI